MEDKLRSYAAEDITVTWSAQRCIHVAACVRGLPEVFKPGERPWIQTEKADAALVAEVVQRCPTGALKAQWADGNSVETAPAANVITVAPDGPLYLRADVQILSPAGEVMSKDSRVALCRCGASESKPFCDGSHSKVGFQDTGVLAENRLKDVTSPGKLSVQLLRGGPLLITGAVTLKTVDDSQAYQGARAALCRCGASDHKPFCDGSHSRIGFET